MRLEVNVPIGGETVAPDETGVGELARILLVLAAKTEDGHLLELGDTVTLADFNDRSAGTATLVPDWGPGDQVWITTTEGSLLQAAVERCSTLDGWTTVWTRMKWTEQLLSPVTVDRHGHDLNGRPRLGRIR